MSRSYALFWLEELIIRVFTSSRLLSSRKHHMLRHWLLAGTHSNLLAARSAKETTASVLQVYREGGEEGDTEPTVQN